jgi:hypothetical protein
MRLYTNNQGSWVGTQADAKREFGKDWREVDVPTSKDDLLEFINFYAVGGEKVSLLWLTRLALPLEHMDKVVRETGKFVRPQHLIDMM